LASQYPASCQWDDRLPYCLANARDAVQQPIPAVVAFPQRIPSMDLPVDPTGYGYRRGPFSRARARRSVTLR